jgi:chaperonin cofactor prefoldin
VVLRNVEKVEEMLRRDLTVLRQQRSQLEQQKQQVDQQLVQLNRAIAEWEEVVVEENGQKRETIKRGSLTNEVD